MSQHNDNVKDNNNNNNNSDMVGGLGNIAQHWIQRYFLIFTQSFVSVSPQDNNNNNDNNKDNDMLWLGNIAQHWI